ncbi:MAG: hypothetical protein KGI38_09935 [Thaumarchaeota archaeon]|nr:hypothetical protein [Nitrososphaerota archaeon]
MRAKVNALLVAALLSFVVFTSAGAYASNPSSGTLTPTNTVVQWGGTANVPNPTIGLSSPFDPTTCQASGYCDLFTLDLNIPSNFALTYPNYFLNITITWANTSYDYDIYVYYNGTQIGSGTLGSGTSYENVLISHAHHGYYQVYATNWAVPPNTPYSGVAVLGLTPPPYSFPTRSGTYVDDTAGKSAGKPYTFTPDLPLVGALNGGCEISAAGLQLCSQDLEPGIKIDQFGTIYAAAIQGTPGGTDFWRSTDGGTTFQYLGQPDGAQTSTISSQTIGGLGGGDEDLALGSPFVLLNASNRQVLNSTGRIYLSSLFWDGLGVNPFPESITVANSITQGTHWLTSQTTVPLDDRQWSAAEGTSNYWITYNDLGAEVAGATNLVMLQSTNGGLTFTNGAFMGKALGTNISIFQGPVATGPDGSLYNAYIGPSPNQIQLVKCQTPCNLPLLPLSPASLSSFTQTRAFKGPSNMSTASVFPQVAVDRAGNTYVAWSDGTDVFLIGSSDGGHTWTLPVKVNNGPETVTAVEPWLQAGDNGRVGVMWYGTNVKANSPDNFSAFASAGWKIFYAVTPDAMASSPTFYQTVASGGPDLPDGVVHIGAICNQGTACPSGTRNLAEYSSFTVDANGMANMVFVHDVNTTDGRTQTDFTRQTAGPSLFGPSLGRATGAGFIAGASGKSDHFNFRIDSTSAGLQGSLKYLDQGSSVLVTSDSIGSFTITGSQATFTGTATLDDGTSTTLVTFTVQVFGNQATASGDAFSISLSNGYSASGQLGGGNIVVLSSGQT